ncbi:MAG: HAMP domain-containing histidine kinase [Alphaproteobacteria bacterium]|nr:HAMP domain-containing histidine kinase [Alphaproteobacteria bacterium]
MMIGWIKHWLDKLATISEKRVEEYGASYVAFGVFSAVNYLIPMYMWSEWHANDVSVYTVRIVAIVLSFVLSVSDSWDDSLKKYRPLFWHFTVMFCLPFLVTFMLLFEGVTLYWIVNINIAVLFGVILLDFASFIVVYAIGVILGVLVSYLLGHISNIELPNYLVYPYFYMMVFVLGILIIFARDLSKKYSIRMKAMRMLAASMAHEIRTPLSTISMILHGLDLNDIPEEKRLKQLAKRDKALREVNCVFNTIDTTLIKLAFNGNKYLDHEELSAEDCIRKAIDEYPFFQEDRSLVHVKIVKDFHFSASRNLFIHVIFNLIQNALYQIKAERKGQIYITVDKIKKRAFVSVKDTASGIKPEDINDIFKPFFTLKNEGTGVGLYFCKSTLRSMDANIYCQSVYGKYAEFIIRFDQSW